MKDKLLNPFDPTVESHLTYMDLISHGGTFVLKMKYTIEDKNGNQDERTIAVPITSWGRPYPHKEYHHNIILSDSAYPDPGQTTTTLFLGDAEISFDDYYMSEEVEVIKRVAKEVTIEEIEKELGYKIKIVGGKN